LDQAPGRKFGKSRHLEQSHPYYSASRHYSAVSWTICFLCLGFLRLPLGSIERDGFTGPTRSRAIARTSLGWSSNLGGLRFMLDSICTRRPHVEKYRPDGAPGY